MRLRASISTLVCAAVLITSGNVVASAAPPAAASSDSLTSLVTKMELVVFGSTRKNSPLAQRISNLEIHAACQTQKGTLKARVDKLVQVIGLTKSETAPPFAPPIATSISGKPHAAPIGTRATDSDSPNEHPPATAANKADEVRHVLVQGIKLHQNGNLSDAEQKFKQVLKLDPYNADACFSLGSLAEGKGDLAGALGYYSAAAVANPNDREARDAVLQVQERIAQQQGPFVNPLSIASANGSAATPLLQARASEFTAADIQQQGMLYPQNPSCASLGTPTFPTGNIRQSQPIPTLNVGQNPPPRQSSGTGKAVARGLARVAVGAALNASGLHCPLCNILRGF